MTALAVQGPIPDSLDQLFEPLELKTLADLFAEYEAKKGRMVMISKLFDGSNAEVIQHFIKGNLSDSTSIFSPETIFKLDRALKALDAAYWRQALDLTDVVETMPQKRRDEWHEQIRELKTPPFEEGTVVSTLKDLLAHRHKFFAERVDGVFRALSPEHLTNRPEGFSKRMILNYVHNGGYADVSRCGIINDLRCVIARFMGRDEPRSYTAMRIVEKARREHRGEWVSLDGGALRVRIYKKGTAHLEVHPEMAWRLNSVLAYLYPNAIPEKHRTRAKRRAPKEFKLYSRPLPFPVLELIINGRLDRRTFSFHYDAHKSMAYKEACDVLVSLGGTPCNRGYEFDYDVGPVLSEVTLSGVLPDQKAHQYYPTPANIAEEAVRRAEIGAQHSVLEPSAGQGGLAEHLPKDRTTLVEVSEFHCSILRAKGYTGVVSTDFLRWSPGRRFDRIVMNPPFAKSQWRHHVEHASTLLAAGGRMVAVLPAGARSGSFARDALPGWSCTWSETFPFPGTSIEVTILTAARE